VAKTPHERPSKSLKARARLPTQVKANGGFWSGDGWSAATTDYSGIAAGQVWVCWEQVVSVTIS